ASTATTLAAFFPLGLWPGTIGKFMVIFPITLSIVLGSSLFVALIINSMLTSEFMKTEEEEITKKKLIRLSLILGALGIVLLLGGFLLDIGAFRGIGNILILLVILLWLYKYVLTKAISYFQYTALKKLENRYENTLKYALSGKRAYAFFFGTVIMLILSFILIGAVQPNVLFFPENEPKQIITYIEYPEGTDIQKTNQLTKQVEKRIYDVIQKYNDDGYNYMVESAISQVGEGAGNPQTDGGQQNEMPHKGKITLSMREFNERRGVRSSDVMEEIRAAVHGFPGASIIVEKDAAGPPAGYPINIEIKGEDYEEMLAEAENMRSYIQRLSIEGIEELKIDVNKSKSELEVIVDRRKAGQLGVSTVAVGQTLRRAIYGEEVSTYKEGDDDYEVNVRFNEKFRYDENALFNQPITFRDQNNGQLVQVPISALVNTEVASSFSSIKRKDLKRVITVYSNVLGDYNANEIVQQLKTELQNYELPEDMSFAFTGEQEEQADNMAFLLKALLIAIGGILLILVAQFNSISKPIIIISAVVLSLVGVFFGLIIFQMDFVIIMTMMGIISLAGIVVNNAIVLIDYTQILIDRKKNELGLEDDELLTRAQYFDCIVRGGKSRLRPVLLTAITTVLGLIPLAIGLNIDFFGLMIDYDPRIYIGGDNVIFWGPLAWTVIFGLVFATFLTLIVVPVMFYLVNRAKVKTRDKKLARKEQRLAKS
ncbi:MAG TPA: copper transporter, partial [Zunongwangia profunda]|nr:copper transporter [Zunongwangia profunda]